MLKTKQIFDKYEDEIARLQYKNFNPTSTQDLNAVNKKQYLNLILKTSSLIKIFTTILLENLPQQVLLKQSYVKMIDKFVAKLFTHIAVKKHGTTIDEIDYPGIASTVKVCVEYPGLNVYNDKAITLGFKSHNNEVVQFEAVGNLGSLGLGFFNDIKVPIYRGGFEIFFTRNNDNNVIYRWKSKKADGTDDAATLPNEGKITIKTFYLRVPIIEYNTEAQIKLTKEIIENSFFLPF